VRSARIVQFAGLTWACAAECIRLLRGYIRTMSSSSDGEIPASLNPVLEAAMNDLTSWVYDSHVASYLRPRQLTTHFHLDGPATSGRAACVAMFKTFKHGCVEWDTAALCDWATKRGWVPKDVALLREFGNGIQSGARFHTGPVPFARSTFASWLLGETTRRTPRTIQIMSCCHKNVGPPPSRAERMSKSSGRFEAR
jgi:hypothetical protein